MNASRLTLLLPGIALTAAIFTTAGAQPRQDQPPQIVTSGKAEVRVAPDRATVTLGVQSRARTATEASAENARKQRAVVDALRAKGIAPEQISTAGFHVVPETRYDRPGQAPTTPTYLVSNTVAVELRRVDQVGEIIDAAIAAGANQVHSLAFTLSNADSARRAALTLAVARARGDADAAARAAGGSLGPLLELTTTEFEVPGVRPVAFAARGMEAAETPIEPGLQHVRAAVTVRWRFIPSAPP